MAEQRLPGRPVNAERFGREKVISGFRSLIREGRGQITRKDIAAYVGITPALVTYYFPESSSIFQDGMSGIFDHWLARIDNVEAALPKQSLIGLAEVIIDFFRIELHAEELFRSLVRGGLLKDRTLHRMEEKTASKIFDILNVTEDDSVLYANILWGATRQFAFSGIADLMAETLAEALNHLSTSKSESAIIQSESLSN